MKCLYCGEEVPQIEGKKLRQFCDNNSKCRMAYKRSKSEHLKANKSEQIKSEQPNPNKSEQIKNEQITYRKVDGKVYGRQAVIFSHEEEGITNSSGAFWTERPEPLNSDDIPDKNNRCFFKRKDGSRYHFDYCGNVFDIE